MAEPPAVRFGLPGGRGTFPTTSPDSKTEHAVTAEQLGFHSVWFSEAHFSARDAPVRRHPVAPIVLASAVAARTSRIRLGVSALLELQHPILVAEQIASLDALCGGRVDLVVGAATDRYRRALGSDAGGTLAQRLDAVLGHWAGRPIEVDGTAHVVEPPIAQRPHPPIYVPATDKETITWAARRGHCLVIAGLTGPAGLRRALELFAEQGGALERVAVERFCLVAESDARAHQAARPLLERLVAQTRHPHTHEPAPADLRVDDLDADRLATEIALVGGPATVVDRLAALRDECGVRAVNLRPSLTGLCPLPRQQETVALFAEQVLPRLTGR